MFRTFGVKLRTFWPLIRAGELLAATHCKLYHLSFPFLRFKHSITRNGLKVMSMMFEDGQGGISSAVGNPVSPPRSLFNVKPISLILESTDGDSGRWGYPYGRYVGTKW